ncbi:peptidoglycan-binding protein [Streptomyces sp. NPDC057620]|uniref:peptidoglycan-binding domain-containing protein n=1 Tax=Streptomyces sp. NPDC057620 TaxID=3346185 RepID=UPI00367962C5
MSYRTSRNKPRALAALGALAAVLTCGVTVSPAASAAAIYPTCNKTKSVSVASGHSVTVPAYGSENTLTCKLVLDQDKSNPAVKALQRSLKSCEGYVWLDIDGFYGPQTFLAVDALQGSYGLSRDGIYGPNTRDSMKHYSPTLGCARL